MYIRVVDYEYIGTRWYVMITSIIHLVVQALHFQIMRSL